jgi:hypothetical protein
VEEPTRDRQERAALNQSMWREINELALTNKRDESFFRKFVCECAAENCVDEISVTEEAYSAVRKHPDHFFVKPSRLPCSRPARWPRVSGSRPPRRFPYRGRREAWSAARPRPLQGGRRLLRGLCGEDRSCRAQGFERLRLDLLVGGGHAESSRSAGREFAHELATALLALLAKALCQCPYLSECVGEVAFTDRDEHGSSKGFAIQFWRRDRRRRLQ